MARPWVLLVLVMLVLFTSQFEWNKQLGDHIQHATTLSANQPFASNPRHTLKEKIILSQENNIQKLNELVRSLREQLQQCKSKNYVVNSTVIPSTEHLNEIERHSISED